MRSGLLDLARPRLPSRSRARTCDGNTVSETIEVRAYDPQKNRHVPLRPSPRPVPRGHRPLRLEARRPELAVAASAATSRTTLRRRSGIRRAYRRQRSSVTAALPDHRLQAAPPLPVGRLVPACRTPPTAPPCGQAPGVNTYGMVDSGLAVKVPESTLTAGVNYSTDFSRLQDLHGERLHRPHPDVDRPEHLASSTAGTGAC